MVLLVHRTLALIPADSKARFSFYERLYGFKSAADREEVVDSSPETKAPRVAAHHVSSRIAASSDRPLGNKTLRLK
jgi:hypothetical protein